MKLIRWVEDRLSLSSRRNKRSASKGSKDKRGGYPSPEVGSTPTPVRPLIGSTPTPFKRTQNETQPDSAQRSIQPPRESSTPAPGAILPKEPPIPSSPSLGSGTPSLNRQRSRIKTNPWLRSPWPSRQSYGSTTSSASTSTDSGCINDCTNTTPANSASNFGPSSTRFSSSSSQPAHRHSDGSGGESHSEPVSPRDGACSSSDELVSSASSSSVFSSRSSSITSSDRNSDILWSMTTLPSAISLLSSEAIAPSPWTSSNSSLLSSTTPSLEPLEVSLIGRQISVKAVPRKCAQINNRRFFPVVSRYSKFGKNEEWVSMATDLISLSSSDDEEEDRRFNRRPRYVPSPAPGDPLGFSQMNSSLGAEEPFYALSSKLSPSPPIDAQGHVPSPAPMDWTLEFASDRFSSSLDYTGSHIIEDLIRNTCSRSSPGSGFEPCAPLTPLTPNSPQTDSGLGLSEGLSSSSSTTPSAEVCQTPSVDRFEEEEVNFLSHKVSRLRLELKNIVDVAIHEAREEEIRMREERLAFFRELMEYKRLLLLHSLDDLKTRFSETNL